MASRLVAVDFDAQNPGRLAQFWAGLLGRDVVDEQRGPILPGDETQLGLRFTASARDRVTPNLMHLHVTSQSPGDQQETVARALGLGAAHIDVGQRPEEGHVVLADPGGNEFCVIEPGNSFLAGCGLLGELACEGTREVGVFWSEALGWPLVWDQDGETAVQSPQGGTKVAWGGPPVASKTSPSRQRVELAVDGEFGPEVARLLSLGASRFAVRDDGCALLADPDGNDFHLTGG